MPKRPRQDFRTTHAYLVSALRGAGRQALGDLRYALGLLAVPAPPPGLAKALGAMRRAEGGLADALQQEFYARAQREAAEGEREAAEYALVCRHCGGALDLHMGQTSGVTGRCKACGSAQAV